MSLSPIVYTEMGQIDTYLTTLCSVTVNSSNIFSGSNWLERLTVIT